MPSIHSRSTGTALAAMACAASLLVGGAGGALGNCGPFTDLAPDAYCPFVLEIFYLGITTGTTATTYDPAASVPRLQAAAFLSRTVDAVLERGSRRAALGQFWTTRDAAALGVTTLGASLEQVVCDGADVWVAMLGGGVARVRASDGRLLETWTAERPFGIAAGMGRIFVVANLSPGHLSVINPSEPAGYATVVSTALGNSAQTAAFDGSRVWVANNGSVSIATPGPAFPWTVTTVPVGFLHAGILYDGSNIWITDGNAGTIARLDSQGGLLQTVTVGAGAFHAVFDGANIWVPAFTANSVSVVRASSGEVLATLTGNGLNNPITAAFDGERVLVANWSGNSASLWRAADLQPLGSVVFAVKPFPNPIGVCSDGVNFWISMFNLGTLLRF